MQRLLLKRMRRSLWRIKLRVAVVLLLIVFAASLTMVLGEFTRNAQTIYDDFYDETNFADLVISSVEHTSAANLSAACDRLMATNGDHAHDVAGCESRLMIQGQYLNEDTGEWILARFYGIDTAASPSGEGTISTLFFEDGSGRTATAIGEAVIDTHVTEEQGVGAGDTATARIGDTLVNYTITGSAYHPHHLYFVGDERTLLPEAGTFAVLYMPATSLAFAAGLPADARNEWLIDIEGTPAFDLQDTPTIDEGEDLRPLKGATLDALEGGNLSGWTVADRGGVYSAELLRQDLEGSVKTLPFMTILLAVISGLVIAVSLDRLVKSQSKEIAVQRALGFPAAEIRNTYLLVPVTLAVTGSLIALPLGWFGSEWMTTFYFGYWGLPPVTSHHYWEVLLLYPLAVIAIVSIFGIRPALRASRLTPLEVMRDQGAVKPSRLLQRLTGSLPPTLEVGVRSTFRKPLRLFVTVFGLGLSLVIIGSMAIFVGSMLGSITGGFEDVEQWDSQAFFLPSQEEDLRNWSAAHPEVTAEWVAIAEGNATGDERTFAVYGMSDFRDSSAAMRDFDLEEGRMPVAGQDPPEVLMDVGSASFLEWEVGEVHEIHLVGVPTEVRIVGTVHELGRSVYLDHGDLSDALGFELYNAVWLKADTMPADLDEEAWVVHRQELIDGITEAWEAQLAIMNIMYFVGALIGGAVLLNTLLINLAERDAELATLRVLGASKTRLSGILLVEHTIIGLAGGLLASALSWLVALALLGSFRTWAFYFELRFDAGIFFWITLGVVLAAALTTLVGTWRIRRMDLVEKVKEFAQ